METRSRALHPIELAPLEIRQSILISLSDLRSLASAALSCRSLYSALVEDEKYVLRQVIINKIGADVLPEAILVLDCTPPFLSTLGRGGLTEPEGEELHDFALCFVDQLARPVPSSIPWDWKTAITLERFHFYVAEFAERFIQFCAESTHIDLSKTLDHSEPSAAERARIERVIYRFELFRKLMGLQKVWNAPRLAIKFFGKFAPWENAQLACVHDFLAWQVIPAFDEVAEHDVAWGKHFVIYENGVNSLHIQYLLSLGLEACYRITTAESWEDKRNLMCVGDLPPKITYWFLFGALRTLRGTAAGTILGPVLNAEEQQQMADQHPFCDDGDMGPKRIWMLSRNSSKLACYEGQHWVHRRWGYVMWDEARLQTLSVLEQALLESEEPEPRSEETPIRQMRISWCARADIYDRGGRGWWDYFDETQVMWPKSVRETPGHEVY